MIDVYARQANVGIRADMRQCRCDYVIGRTRPHATRGVRSRGVRGWQVDAGISVV